MATRISAEVDEHGNQTVSMIDVPEPERARLDSMYDTNEESAARKRLSALKAQRGESKPVAVVVGGETFYVRRLNYKDMVQMACTVNRDATGALDLDNEAILESVTLAVLKMTVTTETGEAYFDHAAIEDYMEDADERETVEGLFAAALRVNPQIFATLEKKVI